MGPYSIAFLLFSLAQVTGELFVVSGPSPNETYTTAHYIYYGDKNAVVEAPAVYLNADDCCSPKRSAVEGKIVYTDRSGAPDCVDADRYERLVKAGAVGFVYVAFWNPPGVSCFSHHEWDPISQTEAMPFVSTPLIGASLDDWKSSNLVLRLSGPHDTSYHELFQSVIWALVMRGFVFAFGVHVALHGYCVVRHTFNGTSTRISDIRVLTYAVSIEEGMSACILGTLHLLGQGGPTVMPAFVHNFFVTYLYGLGLSSNFALAIALREEVQCFKTGIPRRSIFKKYKCVLGIASAVLISSDFFSGLLGAEGDRSLGPFRLSVVLVLFFAISTLLSGAYFIQNARSLSVPLMAFVRIKEAMIPEANGSEGPSHIGRLAYRWAMIGFYQIISIFLGILIAIRISLTLGKDSTSPYQYMLFRTCIVYCRLSLAKWQILAMKSKHDETSPFKMAKWLLGWAASASKLDNAVVPWFTSITNHATTIFKYPSEKKSSEHTGSKDVGLELNSHLQNHLSSE